MSNQGCFKLLLSSCILLLTFFIPHSSFASKDDGIPDGKWVTFEDGKPRSMIQVWHKNGKFYGKIAKVWYRAGEGPGDLCTLCKGDRKNKPFLGMTILWGNLKPGPFRQKGEILDPTNGKVYQCRVAVSESGDELSVLGFIGVPLFGRTETWQRYETLPPAQKLFN